MNVHCRKEMTKEYLLSRKTKQEASSPSLPRRTMLCPRVVVVMDSSIRMVVTKAMVNLNKDVAKRCQVTSHSRTIIESTRKTGKQHSRTKDFNRSRIKDFQHSITKDFSSPTTPREANENGVPRDTECRNLLYKFPPILLQLSQS